jgi:hypothetical protein
MYDIAKAGFNICAKVVEALQVINRERQRAQTSRAPAHAAPRVAQPAARPRPQYWVTEFGQLVAAMEERANV